MKKKLILPVIILATLTLLWNCKKTEDTTPTKTELATKSWIANEAIALGTTVYKKGASTNVYDLSKYVLNVKADGNFDGIDQAGIAQVGTWKFLTNETQVELKTSTQTAVWDVQTLTATNLDLYGDVTINSTKVKTTLKLIPKP